MQHPGVTLNKLGSLHLKKSLPTQPFDSWFPAGWRLCCLEMQVLAVLSWLSWAVFAIASFGLSVVWGPAWHNYNVNGGNGLLTGCGSCWPIADRKHVRIIAYCSALYIIAHAAL